MLSHLVALLSFQLPNRGRAPIGGLRAVDAAMNFAKAKPIHTDPSNPMKSVFKVEKATEKQLAELGVKSWPTWSTEGSAKYKTGEISALKVYDTNELSYIISGKMEIIPEETGKPVLVQAGGARAACAPPFRHPCIPLLKCALGMPTLSDFVTFPDEFACRWHVLETVNKHWFLYDAMGMPDV